MGAFEYTALDAAGRERKGVLEGDAPRQIRQQLRDKGLSPLSVVEVRQREQQQAGQGRRRFFERGISATDLALITRQFATLVHSALPLEEALRVVSQQTEKPRLRSMLMGVRSRVMEGHSLATALEDYPHIFPELFRTTVGAGEHSGHLDVVLERLADYTESRQVLKQRVSLALIYPVLMLVVAITVVTALLAYVVPQVVEVFANTGQELPWLTRALISASDFIRDNGIVMFFLIVVVGVGFRLLIQRPGPRFSFHRALLMVPMVSRLIRGLNAARFARTLSILAASGVPILEGLRVAAQVLSNLPMRHAVEEGARMVREGSSLHVALERSGFFPPMTVHLIASGESSGNLEGMLERAAISQEREVETLIAATLGVFEPGLIVVMGGIVLLIVIAILLPIFDLNQLLVK